MISVDTNVVVRFLIGDDADQFERAKRVFASERIFIPTSVLLESEWVLRAKYEVEKPTLLTALRRLVDLPNVTAENRPAAQSALAWAELGMDFADALHLAASASFDGILSFDKKLARVAARLGAPAVREP